MVKKEKDRVVFIRCTCNQCEYAATKYDWESWNYCPSCGGKIVEEE